MPASVFSFPDNFEKNLQLVNYSQSYQGQRRHWQAYNFIYTLISQSLEYIMNPKIEVKHCL